eukprot:2975483-Rhodomonas_salina.1
MHHYGDSKGVEDYLPELQWAACIDALVFNYDLLLTVAGGYPLYRMHQYNTVSKHSDVDIFMHTTFDN